MGQAEQDVIKALRDHARVHRDLAKILDAEGAKPKDVVKSIAVAAALNEAADELETLRVAVYTIAQLRDCDCMAALDLARDVNKEPRP